MASLKHAGEVAESRFRTPSDEPIVRGVETDVFIEIINADRWSGGLPPGEQLLLYYSRFQIGYAILDEG
ncbi:MAG: hypothetical protein AAGE52_03970 [Myxococcota bacterium]